MTTGYAGMNLFSSPYDVRVLQLLQERDLPDSCRGNAFIFSFQSDLLQGDDLVRYPVFGLGVDDEAIDAQEGNQEQTQSKLFCGREVSPAFRKTIAAVTHSSFGKYPEQYNFHLRTNVRCEAFTL